MSKLKPTLACPPCPGGCAAQRRRCGTIPGMQQCRRGDSRRNLKTVQALWTWQRLVSLMLSQTKGIISENIASYFVHPHVLGIHPANEEFIFSGPCTPQITIFGLESYVGNGGSKLMHAILAGGAWLLSRVINSPAQLLEKNAPQNVCE